MPRYRLFREAKALRNRRNVVEPLRAESLLLLQPQISKHLRVLREVGLVEVRDEGRQRMYRLNGRSLKPIHDWVKNYERTWNERFEALDEVLEELKGKGEGDGDNGK